jgi:hypothetical protein
MLIRFDGEDAIIISQPAHAWVSGQLARNWGNDQTPGFVPYEELCLAAEQHDIGWVPWESAPTLNPETGLPHSFRQFGTETHLDLWSRAGRFALAYGRFPALFVSLHGTGLYERFGPGPDAPQDVREAVNTFLKKEYAFQQRLIESLSSDPEYAKDISPEAIKHNQRLIALWDGISLVLFSGLAEPIAMGDYQLSPLEGDGERVSVDPWPFSANSLELSLEGRRLTCRSATEEELHQTIDDAEWVRLTVTLVHENQTR